MSKRSQNRKTRKNQGIKAWRILSMLGSLQKQVAYKIGVHRAYFSRVVNEQEEAALSEEKLQKLNAYVIEKITAIVKQIFTLGLAPVEVISTAYGPSEFFTTKQENLIRENVVNSIASLLAGKTGPPRLPDGVPAATVRVAGGPHCEIYVIVTKRDGKDAQQAQIHECDHLADYFRDKANELRARGEQLELPEQGL